jgi:hypothetical protein
MTVFRKIKRAFTGYVRSCEYFRCRSFSQCSIEDLKSEHQSVIVLRSRFAIRYSLNYLSINANVGEQDARSFCSFDLMSYVLIQ